MRLFERKCVHKWRIPLMYNPNGKINPTECIKCGESVLNINDYIPNKKT